MQMNLSSDFSAVTSYQRCSSFAPYLKKSFRGIWRHSYRLPRAGYTLTGQLGAMLHHGLHTGEHVRVLSLLNQLASVFLGELVVCRAGGVPGPGHGRQWGQDTKGVSTNSVWRSSPQENSSLQPLWSTFGFSRGLCWRQGAGHGLHTIFNWSFFLFPNLGALIEKFHSHFLCSLYNLKEYCPCAYHLEDHALDLPAGESQCWG